MAGTTKFSLEIHKEGLIGKGIEIAFLEKRKARNAVRHAVRDKNAITKEIITLMKLIRDHKITSVREKAEEIIEMLYDGLQNTYDSKFEALLSLKVDLQDLKEIIEKNGSQIAVDDLRKVEADIAKIEEEMLKFGTYLNELDSLARSGKTGFNYLKIEYEKYSIRMANPISSVFEWFLESQKMKDLFKIDRRLEKLEHKKELNKQQIHQILVSEKNYAEELGRMLKDLCVYTYILISAADKASEQILYETSDKRLNLPKTMGDIAHEITYVFNDEVDALESLRKARNQILKDYIPDVRNAIRKAELKSKQAVRA